MKPGERALKETRHPVNASAMTEKARKAARVFSYYHPRCVPRTENKSTGEEDIFEKGRRQPGSFESGKKQRWSK